MGSIGNSGVSTNTQSRKDFIKDIANSEMTNSDIQAVVEARALTTGENEEELMTDIRNEGIANDLMQIFKSIQSEQDTYRESIIVSVDDLASSLPDGTEIRMDYGQGFYVIYTKSGLDWKRQSNFRHDGGPSKTDMSDIIIHIEGANRHGYPYSIKTK